MKKIIKFGIPIIAIASPIAMVVSCDKNSDEQLKIWKDYANEIKDRDLSAKDELIDIKKIVSKKFPAKIINWIDGDTPLVEFDNPFKGSKKWKIRVSAIDTPESHYKASEGVFKDTAGDEKKWADKATEFAKKTIPIGSSIIVVSDGSKSYNRLVGSIFFGDFKKTLTTPKSIKDGKDSYDNGVEIEVPVYKNYSVEILKEGLAMPFVSNISDYSDDESLIHYIGKPLADAFGWSVRNKKGLFGIDYNKILKEHGATSYPSIVYKRWTDDEWVLSDWIKEYDDELKKVFKNGDTKIVETFNKITTDLSKKFPDKVDIINKNISSFKKSIKDNYDYNFVFDEDGRKRTINEINEQYKEAIEDIKNEDWKITEGNI